MFFYNSRRLINTSLSIHVAVTKKTEVAQALANRIRNEVGQVQPGAPSITITDQTLFDGIVKLNHFRPKVTEEVHVANLSEKFEILGMKHRGD